MRKLIVGKEIEKEIKESSLNYLYNKLNLFNFYINNKDKKVNIKQFDFPKNHSQLNINLVPVNLNGEKYRKISNTNYNRTNKLFNSYSSDKNIIRLTKNFSNSFYNEKSNSHLSNDDKKKLKSIINNFNKNKVMTQQLFNQEKRLRLNSINKTNYFFFVNTEKYNKIKKSIKSRSRNKNKNKNSITKKFSCSIFNKKSRNLRLMTNNTNYSSSSMINRFNNKTTGILDTSSPESIYNKNLNIFRRQIINDFRDQRILENDVEFSKMKYEDAIKVLEEAEKFYIKRAVETEKKFYKAKNNQLKIRLKDKGIENNEEKDEENKVEKKIIPSLFKKSVKNLSEERKEKKRENTVNLKDEKILSNLNLVISLKKNKNERNSEIFDQDNNKSINKLILYEKSEKHRNSINKSFQKKINFTSDNNYLYKIERNKEKKLKINTSEIVFNQNIDLNLLMPLFYKIHKKNRLNRIKEKSKDYANSILEINSSPYQPMKKTNSNCSFIEINRNNLSRAIKINTINKYLYNIKDEELLVHNPKKLREELLKTHMKFYKISFKKKFNHNFLRKQLKPETIRKFAYIKDSYFGVPC